MKRLLLVALIVLLSNLTLSAQNANVKYSGDAQPGEKVYSCAYDGYVNMRQTPSFNAAKIGKFKNGPTGATLIRNLGEWMEINYNGVRGYVPSRFVQDEPTVAYTGSATVNDITGMWRAGFFGPLSIYNNGYWALFGNYFYTAYGYYILQNNEIKLIAIKEISHDRFMDENGDLVYLTVRNEYSIKDISIFNNENRVDFLTGYESDEEMEGVDPALCTRAEFMEYGKWVKDDLRDIIIELEEVAEQIEDEEIFVTAEEMPTFQGGDLGKFRAWVMQHVKYPPIALENGIQGNVVVKFVVEKDGTLSNIQVLYSPDKTLSDAAIQVLQESPKWEPGKKSNKPVRVTYTLPISFQINTPTTNE
ncbi:MAG: TonB family protein [Alistipes sp.]|nr:TonB family protein [Alistipes sp.]